MIDTHAHLDPPEAEAVLERARVAGVGRVVTVATSLVGAAEALELARRHEGVSAALGIHPHNAADEDADRLDELRELLRHPSVVAVGESGLDYHRDYASHAAQQELFAAHLAIAGDLGLPVVIHTRDADEDTWERLAEHDGPVILHCFSSPDLLGSAIENGWYVSFAGNVTYKNAYALRDAARQVPHDSLLAETDSPYLAPQAVRGKRNEPAYVTHVYAELARVLEVDADDLARQIVANAEAVFDL